MYFSLQNTFQAIVVTDGILKSFAIFTYRCNVISWSELDPIYAKIGINYGGGMEQLHNLSGSPMVNDIDCLSNPEKRLVEIMYDLNIELNPPSTTDSNLRNSSDGMRVTMCMFIPVHPAQQQN